MTDVVSGYEPSSWQYELQLALEDPALNAFDTGSPGPEAAAAAYRVALALGYCRLLRVELSEDIDGIMPVPEAMAAASELIRHCGVWIAEARELPSRWDTAPPGVEEDYCADLFQASMDAWAAFIAISEAHEDCVVSHDPAAEQFNCLFDGLLDTLDQFNRVLREPEILALLSTLVETPLLDQWRKMLDIPNGPYMPWWLDGTLEAVNRKIEALCEKHFNGIRTWVSELTQAGPSPVPRHRAEAIYRVQIGQVLAAETRDEQPPIVALLKWVSPDKSCVARLTVPSQLPAGARLPMEFLDRQDQPLRDMVGRPVWLAGVQQVIDENGLARFDLKNLQEAVKDPSQPMTLEVGAERVEWAAMPS